MNAISEARCQISDECFGAFNITTTNEPRNSQLGICINGRPGVGIAVAENALVFWRYILLLRVAERPDFIALNALALDITDRGVLIFKANRANIF